MLCERVGVACMTSAEALYSFFSGFSIPAYPVDAVPSEAALPYLTFTNAPGYFGEQVSLTCQVWMHTTSEAAIAAVVEEIGTAIGYGGKLLPIEGGTIWLKRGMPWCVPVVSQTDTADKLRQLNITAEYLRV